MPSVNAQTGRKEDTIVNTARATKSPKSKLSATATYEIRRTDGRRTIVTVPASLKMTYGMMIPGTKAADPYASKHAVGGAAVRFYDGLKLIAVIAGVQEIWRSDLTITNYVKDLVTKQGQPLANPKDLIGAHTVEVEEDVF